MITAGTSGFEVLERLREAGYEISVTREAAEPEKHPRTVIAVRGDSEPPSGLTALIESSRDNLKAAIVLETPPEWLSRLFDFYWSGHETPVKLSGGPSGKTETYLVSVSMKNIAAAVAAEIGMPVLEWGRILPEVEEALGSWEGAS